MTNRMVEKARQAKDRLFSGLKNFTKRLSLNQGTVLGLCARWLVHTLRACPWVPPNPRSLFNVHILLKLTGNEEELKHIGRSLKVFYGDCGIQRTDAELISIAQKFAGKRELLFTSMEKKYRDQGLYKNLWRLKENLFGDEVMTLAQAEELAGRKQRQLQQQRQTHQLSRSVASSSSLSPLPSPGASGTGSRHTIVQDEGSSTQTSPRASGPLSTSPTERSNSDGGATSDDGDSEDDGNEVAVEVESDDDVGIAVDVDSDDESD